MFFFLPGIFIIAFFCTRQKIFCRAENVEETLSYIFGLSSSARTPLIYRSTTSIFFSQNSKWENLKQLTIYCAQFFFFCFRDFHCFFLLCFLSCFKCFQRKLEMFQCPNVCLNKSVSISEKKLFPVQVKSFQSFASHQNKLKCTGKTYHKKLILMRLSAVFHQFSSLIEAKIFLLEQSWDKRMEPENVWWAQDIITN